MIELEVIRQKSWWDCAITTTAMVTGKSYEEVYDKAIELFGEGIIDYGLHKYQELELLKSLGCDSIQVIGDRPDGKILWIDGRTYLVTVPSTRSPIFEAHRIVVQCTNGKLKVFDPAEYYETIDFTIEFPHILDRWEVCYSEGIN